MRFTAQRDEEAFAALVRRHGPMVLSVCRRILALRYPRRGHRHGQGTPCFGEGLLFRCLHPFAVWHALGVGGSLWDGDAVGVARLEKAGHAEAASCQMDLAE